MIFVFFYLYRFMVGCVYLFIVMMNFIVVVYCMNVVIIVVVVDVLNFVFYFLNVFINIIFNGKCCYKFY